MIGVVITALFAIAAGATLAATQAPPKAVAFAFSGPTVLPQSGDTGGLTNTCYNPCGEPSMEVAPDGKTVYVSTPRTIVLCCNSKSSPVWNSPDGGRTWSSPSFPAAQESATTGGDTQLMIDKRGTVYEGELWLGDDSMYISTDRTKSWSFSPLSHHPGSDREWLVYSAKQDALYAVYDDLNHGIQVIYAPLGTPAGSNAALFAPVERTLFPEWNDCPGLLAGPCTPKPSTVPDQLPDGTPLLQGTTSPGRPSIAPDGTIYALAPFQTAGKGIVVGIGTPDATTGIPTWKYSYVAGAGHGVFGDTGNDFPVSAVDQAGNLYVAWVENKGKGFQTFVSYSRDHAATWSTPIALSTGISRTAVFPNIVAGAPGRVSVSWYGTNVADDPNNVPSTTRWNVYAAQSINLLGRVPTFTVSTLQAGFHTGSICTHGLGCTGNSRYLLDFFDMKQDGQGATMVVYTRDHRSKTEIAFSRQTAGCSLRAAGYGFNSAGKYVKLAGC